MLNIFAASHKLWHYFLCAAVVVTNYTKTFYFICIWVGCFWGFFSIFKALFVALFSL